MDLKSYTLTDYWMGRDKRYPDELTPDIVLFADDLRSRVVKLLATAQLVGIVIEVNPNTSSILTSGWRPKEVNQVTLNAALRSKHMTGQAVDVFDPEGALDDWLMTPYGQDELVRQALYMEHPSATKGWSHLQSVAPGSGRRVFYP